MHLQKYSVLLVIPAPSTSCDLHIYDTSTAHTEMFIACCIPLKHLTHWKCPQAYWVRSCGPSWASQGFPCSLTGRDGLLSLFSSLATKDFSQMHLWGAGQHREWRPTTPHPLDSWGTLTHPLPRLYRGTSSQRPLNPSLAQDKGVVHSCNR